MSYPDFVCMGFQKCGTTTLYSLLKQHPQIALCRDVKEPMYCRIPLLYIAGGSHYYRKRYFGHIQSGDKRLKGEVNAGLTYSGCEKKVRRTMSPDAKMIFMMRNPVDRSYSAYKYFLARGFLPSAAVKFDARHGHAAGFDHYVHSVLDHPEKRGKIMQKRMKYMIFSQSNYAACIREYLRDYPLQNMKFIVFEEFIRDEHAACREIYDFLGLEDTADINYHEKSNEGNECVISALRAKQFWLAKGFNYFFYDVCAMPYWAPKLYNRYRAWFDSFRSKCLKPDKDKSRIFTATREYLSAYFEADVRYAEKLTGKELGSIWGISHTNQKKEENA